VPRDLQYTDEALSDLDAIASWLTQPGSGLTARRRLAAVWVSLERLREHPCRYPVGHHTDARELPCAGGYRALYEVSPDTGRDETAGDVRVLRVFGPGQSRARL
jgi:plasmid stabilization system protein ParE